MLHLFLTPSTLLAAGEVLVGISLPMFVAALIAAYGDRIRLSGGQWARTDLCTPDPETGLLEGPTRFQRHISRPRALAYRWNRPRTSPSICHGRPDQRPGTRLLRALARSSTSARSAGDNRRSLVAIPQSCSYLPSSFWRT